MASFATTGDVEMRIMRSLSAAEEDGAQLVLELVADLIIDEVGRDEAWALALDPVPGYLRAISIEKALTAIANPRGVATTSETLGAYSRSETYPRAADIGVALSDAECRKVREAVYGAGIASPHLGSFFDDLPEDRSDDERPI